MDRKDWLLLALEMAGERGLDPVQLQKALFIFGEELKKNGTEQYFNFRPYDYGPFDAAVYQVAEEAEAEGLVEIRPSSKSRKQYYMAAQASPCLADLRAHYPESETEFLRRVVEWVQSKSFNDLLRAVYQKYPHMAAKSIFKG